MGPLQHVNTDSQSTSAPLEEGQECASISKCKKEPGEERGPLESVQIQKFPSKIADFDSELPYDPIEEA